MSRVDMSRDQMGKTDKTDRTDVKGILEAYRNEDIRPVPIKTPAHQALVALHRLRSAWVADRTARLNTLRGLLRELGIFIPVGSRKVIPEVWAQLEAGLLVASHLTHGGSPAKTVPVDPSELATPPGRERTAGGGSCRAVSRLRTGGPVGRRSMLVARIRLR